MIPDLIAFIIMIYHHIWVLIWVLPLGQISGGTGQVMFKVMLILKLLCLISKYKPYNPPLKNWENVEATSGQVLLPSSLHSGSQRLLLLKPP